MNAFCETHGIQHSMPGDNDCIFVNGFGETIDNQTEID